jgi:hypothetical protein
MAAKMKNLKSKQSRLVRRIFSANDENNWRRQSKTLKTILVCLFVILLALAVIIALRAYNHYQELRSHTEYFRQPNAPIQDWMTVSSVVDHYNLTETEIYTELNVSPSTLNRELGINDLTAIERLTIEKICARKHLNCGAVLDRLNSLRAK